MKNPLLAAILPLWLLCLFWSMPAWSYHEPSSEERPLSYHTLHFSQAFSNNPNTIRIPFQLVGRLIAVEASVDTITGKFIIDTGAERLLLNKNYVDGTRRLSGGSAHGASGAVKEAWAKNVDSLLWDNLSFFNIPAHVIDMTHLEEKRKTRIVGIIGYEVLKDYEILLDYPARQIMLSKLDRKGNRIDEQAFSEAPIDSINFKLFKHGIIVNGTVQGVPLKFNLDSGAELNLIDRKVKRQVIKNFEIIKRVNMIGAGKKQIEVLAGILKGVECGKTPNYGMRTLLTSLDDLSLTYGGKIHGVLGFEFLRSKKTLINYKKKKIYFFNLVRP